MREEKRMDIAKLIFEHVERKKKIIFVINKTIAIKLANNVTTWKKIIPPLFNLSSSFFDANKDILKYCSFSKNSFM